MGGESERRETKKKKGRREKAERGGRTYAEHEVKKGQTEGR